MQFQTLTKVSDTWEHALEGMTLYISDENNEIVCKIEGKKQLLEMCKAMGLVGTGVRL